MRMYYIILCCMFRCVQVYHNTHARVRMHTYTHTCTHTCTHTHACMHTQTRAHAHIHTRARTHAHTHTRTHAHTALIIVILLLQSLINVVSPKTAVRVEQMVPTDDITLQAPAHCSKTITLSSPSSGGQPVAAIRCLHLSYHMRKVHYVFLPIN